MKAETLCKKLESLKAVTSKPGEAMVYVLVNGLRGKVVGSSLCCGSKKNPQPYLLLKCDCSMVSRLLEKRGG